MKKHYVYRIDRLSTGEYYIGKGSCAEYKDPAKDGYMGSGKVLRDKMSVDPTDWVKSVLYVTESAESAYAVEARLLGDRWATDPQCLNLVEGGSHPRGKMSACAKLSAEANYEQRRDRMIKLWQDPDYCERMSAMMRDQWQDPEYRELVISRVRQGRLDMSDETKARISEASRERMIAKNKDPEFIERRDRALNEARARQWSVNKDKMRAAFKKRKNVKLERPDGEIVTVDSLEVASLLRQGHHLTSPLVSLTSRDEAMRCTLNITGDSQKALVEKWLADGTVLFGRCGEAVKVGAKEFKSYVTSPSDTQ